MTSQSLLRAGSKALSGYALSMVFLAAASLAAIPAMVSASGGVAWGSIAAGQSIGGVAATIIAWGWGLSGPATIARADANDRLTEYVESVISKLLLFVPVGSLAFIAALLVGRDFGVFAAVGALSMSTIGLTANWYFVGAGRPYVLLVCETIPRVLGTAVGIALMSSGSSALVGVSCQLVGSLLACIISSLWIIRPWNRSTLAGISRRPVLSVLAAQRYGVTSTVMSSIYNAAPIVIVSLVAPTVQPIYAVVDKVQRQVIVALGPFVTVLQGWVPRSSGTGVIQRVRIGIGTSAVGAILLGVVMLLLAPELVRWLGNGQITPTFLMLALTSIITAVSLFEQTVSKACLAALRRLDVVARSTAIGSIAGLPLVAIGAVSFGAAGALAGILAGLILRLLLELLGLRKAMVHPLFSAEQHPVLSPALDVDEV